MWVKWNESELDPAQKKIFHHHKIVYDYYKLSTDIRSTEFSHPLILDAPPALSHSTVSNGLIASQYTCSYCVAVHLLFL